MDKKPLNKKNEPPLEKPPQKNGRNLVIWVLVFLGIIYVFQVGPQSLGKTPAPLTYGSFYEILSKNAETRAIRSAEMSATIVRGELSDGSQFIVNLPDDDKDSVKLLRETVKGFDVKPPRTLLVNLFISFGPLLLFIVFLWYMYRGAGQVGGRIWSFGKSRAKLISSDKMKVTYDDVAGVDEAKEELKEVIEFLKDPKKFQRLGGKIPKGVLLLGPPGCGKTLLAKAVAGEAGVTFLNISGSDFVEMFVGVGASRVRDLFEQAKRVAKQGGKGSVIFIDEIDAVGRQRFAGIGGGHDEREQTLNALLVEMDGFDTQEGVILIAATNRPDVLDPALLRPGRFDRQIVVSRPDIIGREAILKVHVKNIKLAKGIDLRSIARQTSGFSGADLANLVNEAALLAARTNKQAVGIEELESAIERVIAGPEKRTRVISDYEKSIVAYHESGHALLAIIIPGADPLHKVSIIPRGMALGYTMRLPLEDRYIMTKSELMGKLAGLLGGRAAEEAMSKEITTGAEKDLEVATAIARRMVCEFGMSEKLGHLTFGRRQEQVFLGRDIGEEKNYSDQTALVIDQEIRKIVDEAYDRAKGELLKNKEKLILLAKTLLEKEVMDDEEVKKILGFDEDERKTKSA
ncbi:MAG: ATP-dependent zinc metalloprotease FtsH [Candidatus Omnitrophica bacterium]|nr:ATP-dependent zinc metalloprotease FtsH [Candidatus Omnitrophota bacterium]